VTGDDPLTEYKTRLHNVARINEMHWIDWFIVLCPLALVAWIGFRTQRYVNGVSDFLSAGL
jgi:hypothetical protein